MSRPSAIIMTGHVIANDTFASANVVTGLNSSDANLSMDIDTSAQESVGTLI